LIKIRASHELLPRGRAWWRVPESPLWIEFTLDERIPAETQLDLPEVVAHVERRLRA
jgi:hypothetical protein